MDADAHRKRVVAISDLHCGHEFGLTPPGWQYPLDDEDDHRFKAAKFQRALWDFYANTIDALKPIDILLVLGDAIDGKGDKKGGTEQLELDRRKQCNIAAKCINYAKADKVRMVYGTPYHVGKGEDWEAVLAEKVCNASVQSHGFFEVNGKIIDVKHKVGGSSIPHGRHTALARAKLWNMIWYHEHERQPNANYLLRGHVHFVAASAGVDWFAGTIPALAYYTAFGARECEGTVHVGLVKIDIPDDGRFVWPDYILAKFKEQQALVESL